jgi:hypothetical protein
MSNIDVHIDVPLTFETEACELLQRLAANASPRFDLTQCHCVCRGIKGLPLAGGAQAGSSDREGGSKVGNDSGDVRVSTADLKGGSGRLR